MLSRWRRWAKRLKQSLHALYLASRHPRMPWTARLLALLVVGYALSPIDLIPDPVPVLGYLDDLLLLPLGIWLVLRLTPDDVWEECLARAEAGAPLPRSWWAAAVVVALWLLALSLTARALWPRARAWLGV